MEIVVTTAELAEVRFYESGDILKHKGLVCGRPRISFPVQLLDSLLKLF